MGRGAWGATVHRVAKCRTRLKRLSTHSGVKPTAWGIPWRSSGKGSPLTAKGWGSCTSVTGSWDFFGTRKMETAHTQQDRNRFT